ncbi:GGDEF domain-containing protein [Pseudoalteromonas piscicida]|nr:GGDEF domain-containing protein [Pseudoalteromonas piscicida]
MKPPLYKEDKLTVEQESQRQQIELVYQSARYNQLLSPLVGAILASVLWSYVSNTMLISWVVCLFILGVWRHIQANARQSVPKNIKILKAWARTYLISLGSVTSMWGFGGVWLMSSLEGELQIVVFCFLMGMSGGFASLYAAHIPSVAVSLLTIMAPAAVFQFLQGGLFHIALGLAGIVFMGGVYQGPRLVERALRENLELTRKLERLVNIDLLSGLYNRRGFVSTCGPLLANAGRAGRSSALLMLDVDNFKQINDQYGHATGDSVIQLMGETLTVQVREGEFSSRIGGEEFAVFLPDASVEHAVALANRILNAVRNNQLEVNGITISITVSIGVAVSSNKNHSFDALMQAADTALYQAKNNGKDQVKTA